MDHLSVLELRLSNERLRLSKATTEHERALRSVYVAQCEREVAGERAFLGLSDDNEEMSIDALFNELSEDQK